MRFSCAKGFLFSAYHLLFVHTNQVETSAYEILLEYHTLFDKKIAPVGLTQTRDTRSLDNFSTTGVPRLLSRLR